MHLVRQRILYYYALRLGRPIILHLQSIRNLAAAQCCSFCNLNICTHRCVIRAIGGIAGGGANIVSLGPAI